MKFVPYERLKIITALSSEEVLSRLADAVEPQRNFRFFRSGAKPYQGSIEGSRFEISRVIGYRNSFLPMIKGDVQPAIGGCSIQITMHPHVIVIVFMAVWMGFIGLILAGLLFAFATSPTGAFDPTILIPAGMLIFGYALILGGFKVESARSKQFFRELFEAGVVEEMSFAEVFQKRRIGP